ncbi:protein CHROMATIN REMODELING 8 [Dorcoceras hygrometricum]|uniref:Protein CHROMATIN REMODELING 8 n=1 Tax=Dorcoceras hygrometricum TaxID=472368 RepID=A0A2Z7CRD5_9LAMI|nr:protein CHROMATIN REMODELING 8 [Dorcoceras hygrometricum]
MDDPGMVSMFQSLMASGLEGFLGCPAVIYEASLVEFFENASVRDGVVVSTVHGVTVEISKQLFAETFELPVEVSTSGKKKMKIEFRLLCDILAKMISVKAGSFDALTMEKFLMLTVIICEVKINWNRVLFNILKDMVTAGSRQAKGYAIQISLLLENISNLELEESSEFPSSKLLTEKTVHRYVVLNDKVGMEEAVDAPKVTRAPKKKAASKKRPAAFPVAEPVFKNKRTTKKKSGSSTDNVEMVAVALEAVPIQILEPIPDASAEETIVEDEGTSAAVEVAVATGKQEPAVEHMDEQMAEPTADVEKIVEEFDEPAVEGTAEQIRPTSADDVDFIIEKVLAETAHIEVDEENHGVEASGVGDQPAGTADDSVPWFNLPYEVLISRDSERVFETASDTDDEEMETIDGRWRKQTEAGELSADEANSVEDILMTIPVDVPLPSAGVEITKITLGQSIKIPGVDERTWYLASLPQIPVDARGKEPLLEKDPVKGHPVKEQILLILVDIECLVQLQKSDHCVKIPKPIVHNEVPRQLSYEDTLPAVSTFFRLMKKRWADVCLAVCDFSVFGKLLPVGSVNFCRSLEIVEPISCFVSRQSTIIFLRLSQFCTVSVQYSLFNGLSIADIRSFFSSIVFEKTVLRDVQRIQSSVSVFPSVQSSFVSAASQNVQLAFSSVVEDEDNQMDIDQRLASPTTTADSSMNFIDNDILLGDDETYREFKLAFSSVVEDEDNQMDIDQRLASPTTTADSSMNFIDNDILLGDDETPNQPSLPTVSNLSTYLDDFRTLLWQRLDAQSEDIRHIGCEGERQYRTLISLLGLLATMRRVVNYHSSWARQRQVELFDAYGIRV